MTPCAATLCPPLAKGTYAVVSSKGVTTLVPSASEENACKCVSMPSRLAARATAFGPTSAVSWTAMELDEIANASARLIMPLYFPS